MQFMCKPECPFGVMQYIYAIYAIYASFVPEFHVSLMSGNQMAMSMKIGRWWRWKIATKVKMWSNFQFFAASPFLQQLNDFYGHAAGDIVSDATEEGAIMMKQSLSFVRRISTASHVTEKGELSMSGARAHFVQSGGRSCVHWCNLWNLVGGGTCLFCNLVGRAVHQFGTLYAIWWEVLYTGGGAHQFGAICEIWCEEVYMSGGRFIHWFGGTCQFCNLVGGGTPV